MTNSWTASNDDESSGLDAFDDYVAGYDDEEDSGLHAFDEYVYVHEQGVGPKAVGTSATEDDKGTVESTAINADGVPDLLISATDPTETVTVTTFLSGLPRHIALSPRAASMTEAELAAEILGVSEIAVTKAQSAQYELVEGLLRIQGQDRDSIRELLESKMGLPTPEQAMAAEAEFNSRYTRVWSEQQ
ncbi:hypothetical protein [Mycobacterium hubeiense]|uniref:hypothetical protein n=1 Tax=Mycobacterium hubeiense TaxID=1867256 RepID=UPI000C7E9497|nr:hypothetical protein [Mycobacterium sp. QGD 101]